MSIFRDNLLAKNQSFISTADELLNITIQTERLRATRAIEALDRVRSGIQGGSSLTDFLGDVGQLSNIISATLGLGAKAVGARSELPFEQQIKINEWRFTKTRSDHKKEVTRALKRTPDPGGIQALLAGDLNSISLFPGQTAQQRDQVQNRYGPNTSSMKPYSQSTGADAVSDFIGRVFPFSITNLAKVGSRQQQPNLVESPGVQQGRTEAEIFPAYIRALNEQFNAQWSQRTFFGRSEDVYIYNQANRSFNLDITLFATTDAPPRELRTPQFIPGVMGPVVMFEEGGYPIPVSDLIPVGISTNEFPALMDNNITKTDLWKKMSFLESLCYPAYDEDGRYSRSPFCRITLGSLWENQLAIIQSVNIAYDPMIWDLNGKHFTPMFINITLAGILIHDTSPGIQPDGTFGYKNAEGDTRYLHRSDFE